MAPTLSHPVALHARCSTPRDERRLWRSLAEAHGHEDRGPAQASQAIAYDRREFMKIMGASLALAGAGSCSRQRNEPIVPYRDGPAQQTYGEPVFYASSISHDGYALGVLVETNMGRPTKIEGNPLHPASLGATDVFRQASVLDLWDPDRSQTVRHGRVISTWNDFLSSLREKLGSGPAGSIGPGLRILTGTVTSPSVHAQITALLERYPGAQWHQWQPCNRDNVLAGANLAYGEPAETLYRFDQARTIVALDGDFLDDHPAFVRYALDFSATRNAQAADASRSRLYAFECTPTLTGAAADHRWPIRASEVTLAAQALAGALGVMARPRVSSSVPQRWIETIASDLRQHAGASIIVAGARQPAHVHALAHAMNEALGNVGHTLSHISSAAAQPVNHLDSLRALVTAMADGKVELLVVSGVNPVYSAPVDLEFTSALTKVSLKLHHGLYLDETALRCDWHVPAAHELESWGDPRSFDGTVSLQQPCIEPLYHGKSLHELLAAIEGDIASSGRDLLRGYWRSQHAGDFDGFFSDALRAGCIDGSASPQKQLKLHAQAAGTPDGHEPDDAVELVFVPDPRTGDGSYANNAWLQELPKPLSQLTWDNAALISPAFAQRLGIQSEDVVDLRLGDRSISVPAWIMPGMPDRSVSLALGYGRSGGGGVAKDRGANAYALRGGEGLWLARGLSVERTGRRNALACAQTHHRMEGREPACAADCRKSREGERTLYASPPMGPYAWAMSIDLSACIGCGACTVACQAENNIPVVGREEVRNGREMHWIRVDRYYEGSVDIPSTLFQPVPCMQCEHAPCEVVCPVEASVHDSQGINVQVYNRCVGTRYCSNNCPYKVRRFNFFEYSRNVPALNAQRNPEVTVRMRGVMEKCNYCLQRVTRSRIAADREGRRLRDGEVVTACQAVCPTRAIVFGDLADPGSEVSRRKRSPLDYALLEELNTRPRTTYLARVANPAAQNR